MAEHASVEILLGGHYRPGVLGPFESHDRKN